MHCLRGARTLTQSQVAFAEQVALPSHVCCDPKKRFRLCLSRAKEWRNTPASEQLEKKKQEKKKAGSLFKGIA